MGRKDILIHKWELAYKAAGYKDARQTVLNMMRVLEDHFGMTYEQIDAALVTKIVPAEEAKIREEVKEEIRIPVKFADRVKHHRRNYDKKEEGKA